MTTDNPKIAVLINGTWPSGLPTDDSDKGLLNTIKLYKHVFRNFDVDWHAQSWTNQRKRFEECGITDDVIEISYVDDPFPDGLPYDCMSKGCEIAFNPPGSDRIEREKAVRRDNLYQVGMIALRENCSIANTHMQKCKYQCHQHIQHDIQIRSIPNIDQYDFIVRMRWDLHMSGKFPLEEILELADKHVVGICCDFDQRHWTGLEEPHSSGFANQRAKNVGVTYEEYLPSAEHRNRVIRNNFYAVIDEDVIHYKWKVVNEDPDCDNGYMLYGSWWEYWLSDPMMIFKPCDIHEKSVIDMINDEEFYGSEHGWWQMLCQKRHHVNVNGLVALKRNTVTSYEDWFRVRKTGIEL